MHLACFPSSLPPNEAAAREAGGRADQTEEDLEGKASGRSCFVVNWVAAKESNLSYRNMDI